MNFNFQFGCNSSIGANDGHFAKLQSVCRALCLVAVFHCLGSVAQALEDYSDPLRPAEMDTGAVASDVSIFQIGSRIQRVEALIEQATQALDALAPLQPAKQFDTFGYHSDYIPEVEGVSELPLWTLDFDADLRARLILGVVLVPSTDQRSSELKGYAFPKRFRICSVNEKGERGEVYVDWTERDFPDPGMRPVFFKFPSLRALEAIGEKDLKDALDSLDSLEKLGEQEAKQALEALGALPAWNATASSVNGLRLEVFSGEEEGGLEFISLARVHLIRMGEIHPPRDILVSSSFESAPYWGADYLASPRHTLGMPLAAKDGADGDFIWTLPASKLDRPLVIRIEVEEKDQLGMVHLFPGHSPDGIDVPGYGFPNSIKINRLIKIPNRERFRRIPLNTQFVSGNPGNNMIRLAGVGGYFDAIEVVCNDFPVYQGAAVFSLGEIEILLRGRNLSRGQTVSLRDSNLEAIPDLGALVDGRVDGRDVLLLPDWLQSLAKGKPHEERLEALQVERSVLIERWKLFRKRATIALGLLAVLAVGFLVVFLQRSRRKAEIRLRRQVHSDLHDEVGSSLGSISLMSGQLEGIARSDQMKEGLFDLSLITREACASLREVVWMVDQDTIRLPMLIQKMTERAERVLTGVDLTIEVPEDCPDELVSLTFKRHLIMFFKEVVHNCARHADATEVRVAISVTGRQLELVFSDNGCGFDPESASDGWGIGSMKQRVQEICGEMELSSRLGEGTTIILKIPLTSLSKEPNKAYKTSN
ncbi:MAG: sensor histidine kinase [Opitutaceae bacterium]